MTINFSYRDYVADATFMEGYAAYQKRFAETARECDKVIIDLVRGIVEPELHQGRRPEVLDLGCSRGNLLRHLKPALPGLALTGGDLVPRILEENRQDPGLAGIKFVEMNLLELDLRDQFDLIIVNAVLFLFKESEFASALANVASALRPGGWLIAFDFFHQFEQDLTIVEKSETHPEGLTLHFRPQSSVRPILERHGFASIKFQPFEIPIDLPRPDSDANIITYTVRTEPGNRLNFRGALYQPWCHLVAQKSG